MDEIGILTGNFGQQWVDRGGGNHGIPSDVRKTGIGLRWTESSNPPRHPPQALMFPKFLADLSKHLHADANPEKRSSTAPYTLFQCLIEPPVAQIRQRCPDRDGAITLDAQPFELLPDYVAHEADGRST